MRLIGTSHLKIWAASKQAESRFPHILKELICAVVQPEKLRIPSGDAVWLPGCDGVVVSSDENRFVPKGMSVWEFGTNSDYKGKANSDYDKRSRDRTEDVEKSKSGPALDRSQVFFVFVTPLVWKHKDKWISAKKKENIWKDVVAIDGVDLQDWLETAPAVGLQFAAELGIVPEKGLQTPDQAWEEWSSLTDPPTSEALVVAGRKEQEKEITSRLISTPRTFAIRGDSPREAWGFALATIRRIRSEDERVSLLARTIVTDDEEVAGRLRQLNNLIIIIKQPKSQVPGFMSSRGCHVIVPEGNDASSDRNVVTLARPEHYIFTDALRNMGLSEDEAERIARACGRSITILQRQLAHANFVRPAWSDGENVGCLLPALLAGRWNARSESDRGILAQLAGSADYAGFEGTLQRFLLYIDEAPLRKIDEMWTLVAPVDAFQLLARHLTSANMERFKDAFLAVFSRIDPKVEIPPDEWIYSDLKGERSHSGWLRSGLAETLLMIAERGTDARLVCDPSPSAYAEDVVHRLPDQAVDWRVLASIRDQYSRLMEAAPNPFLDSLERLLEARPDDLRRLFAEGQGFGGGSMQTGLLWGLEILAWKPEYLGRVAIILARLAAIDPGGRLVNRPINSLHEVFLWWHPSTNASIEERLSAIDMILAQVPDVGWTLLASLLPGASVSVSHGTAKPRWRDLGSLPEDAFSRQGQARYLSAIVDRAIDRVGTEPKRWLEILDSLQALSNFQQEAIIVKLDTLSRASITDDRKAELWEMLRGFIYRQRTFQDANWALTRDLVERLEGILNCLASSDPVERNRWLFEEWFPNLPLCEDDIKKRQEQIAEYRRQAIIEIINAQGFEGLVRIGTICKYPGFVAAAAIHLMKDPGAANSLIERSISLGEAGIDLASHISGQAQQLFGGEWCALLSKEAKTNKLPPHITASLLMWWPDEPSTWEYAAALGNEVAAQYWRKKPVFLIKGDSERLAYQIERLIEAGRAVEALDRASLDSKGIPSAILLRLFDCALEELSRAKTPEEVLRYGLSSHDVRRVLDDLRLRTDVTREELARREYRALPILGSMQSRCLAIHELMAKDPSFFVDILCNVFLPAHHDENEEIEPTPEERARAERGFSLLQGMEYIPGRGEGNQVDEKVLTEWIDGVRSKAKEMDRVVVAEIQIGEILAHVSDDAEDGAWPHRVVRNVIDKLSTEDMENGIVTERINMRGVYSKTLFEGGAQERDLAVKYHDWSVISREHWPKTSRLLETIAQKWEDLARRADREAEQEKLDL